MNLKHWFHRGRTLVASTTACLLVTVTTLQVSAQSAATAALDALPAKAEIVVLVPNLGALNQKLANLNTALGGVAPWMADTLTEFKRTTGMNNGINDNGSLALVLNDVAKLGESEDQATPPFVMLVPVSDYKAFVANFNVNEVDLNTTISAVISGEEAFVRKIGNYAVMGADKAVVDNFASANNASALLARAGKHTGAALNRSDILVLVDLAALAPQLQPKIETTLTEAIKELESNPELAKDSPVDPKVFLQAYQTGIRSFLNSADVAVLGLDISDLGVGLTSSAQFKADSELSKYIVATKTNAATHLKHVANQPYLLAVSMDTTGIDFKPLIASIADPIRKSNPEMGKLIDAAIPLILNSTGSAGAYYPGQLNLAGSLFNSVSVVATEDAAAYAKSFRDYLDLLSKTTLPVTIPAADGSGNTEKANIRFFTQYNPNTTTVDGVAIDQYEMRYDLPPALLAQINPQLMMLTGMAAQRGYVAQVNGKVIVTSTPDLPTLTQAIAAAKSGKGLDENSNLTAVRQQLGSGAAFEAYLNVGTIASTAVSFAQAFGMDTGVQVPQNLPPVGYALMASDNGVAGRTFFPTPVIVFAKDIGVMVAPMLGGMMDESTGAAEETTAPRPPRR